MSAGQVRTPRADIRPMPPDFPKTAQMMNQRGLMRHYRCRHTAVLRWGAECGIDWSSHNLPLQPPDGFLEAAPTMTMKELCSHYRHGANVIRRWLCENGVQAKNTRGRYVKRDISEEVRICTTCPYQKCKLDNHESCPRIGGYV